MLEFSTVLSTLSPFCTATLIVDVLFLQFAITYKLLIADMLILEIVTVLGQKSKAEKDF